MSGFIPRSKSTLPPEKQQAIYDFVNRPGYRLPKGMGDTHSACSIAAINLAIEGGLTDKIPKCMSNVLGEWIIGTQDSIPDRIRNSKEWKNLLPYAAGTGRFDEEERRLILRQWVMRKAIPFMLDVVESDVAKQGRSKFSLREQKSMEARLAECRNLREDLKSWDGISRASASRILRAFSGIHSRLNALEQDIDTNHVRLFCVRIRHFILEMLDVEHCEDAAWDALDIPGLLRDLIDLRRQPELQSKS